MRSLSRSAPTVDGVPQSLHEKLAYQNLVLLHPCIVEGSISRLHRLLHEMAARAPRRSRPSVR